MLKSILTAAAFAALAAPTASAHGVHHSRTAVKKVTPIVAVSPRAVRGIQVVRVSPFVSVAIPRLVVSKPVVKTVVTPRRFAATSRRTVPVRSTRVIRR